MRREKPLGGVFIVLNAVHNKHSPLRKNARIVAVAIGWRMGPRHEFRVGIPQLMEDTDLCKTAVGEAIKEVCGPRGVFEKEKGGPGECNLYRLRPPLMPGHSDILKARNPDFNPRADVRKTRSLQTSFQGVDVRESVCITE